MIDTYTGGWNSQDEKAWFHRRIKNAGVLVVDDVGREYQGRAKNGLPESTFDEVLRHRVAAGTPTFISSNKDMKQLQEGYGGNVMSLLHERSTTYRFTGLDYRDQARMRVTRGRSGPHPPCGPVSARIGRTRRHQQRVRSALRYVWRCHASVRRLYPVKSDWLNGNQA